MIASAVCIIVKQIFPLPLDDYLLGVSDLTGELMRFAINAISHRGGRAKAGEISDFVRNCKAGDSCFRINEEGVFTSAHRLRRVCTVREAPGEEAACDGAVAAQNRGR